MCLCEYGGIIALFKMKAQLYKRSSSISEQAKKDIKRISDLGKIDIDLLTQKSKNSIYQLNEQFYNEIKLSHFGKASYKLYLIEDLNRYLIKDFNDNNDINKQVRT